MTMLTLLIGLALVATIISLAWGVGSMAAGGQYDDKHYTQFMTARIGFQALAIVLLIIASVISF